MKNVQKIIDFCDNNDIKKNDVLIICGDCGIIWNEKEDSLVLKSYENIWPGIIAFIDGNHENFALLNTIPVSNWKGGKVHRIGNRIFHLMRGQVYIIEGKKIFTMGGNESRDRERRIENVDWWAQEKINEQDIGEARRNLARNGNEIDIVITHCAHVRALLEMDNYSQFNAFAINKSSILISKLLENTKIGKWYTGHYHIDTIEKSITFVYNKIIKESTMDLNYKCTSKEDMRRVYTERFKNQGGNYRFLKYLVQEFYEDIVLYCKEKGILYYFNGKDKALCEQVVTQDNEGFRNNIKSIIRDYFIEKLASFYEEKGYTKYLLLLLYFSYLRRKV